MSIKLNLPKKYPYAYETHLHTREGSACSAAYGSDMAIACKAAGYTGMIVTDHFYYGNTAVDRSLAWSEWVEQFCEGYESAKQQGDKIGLQVFFGWEASYEGTDFLVYGPDKEWLLKHPEIKDATIEQQYYMIHEAGGIVIHAHPFRKASYIPGIRLFPEFVDGVETVNATHVWTERRPDGTVPYDVKAKAYAKEYGFIETAGSDIHSVHLIGGGMAFQRKLEDVEDFINAVMTGNGKLLP